MNFLHLIPLFLRGAGVLQVNFCWPATVKRRFEVSGFLDRRNIGSVDYGKLLVPLLGERFQGAHTPRKVWLSAILRPGTFAHFKRGIRIASIVVIAG